MKLEGIHHVTCITGDAPANVDFYTRVLGLRMVKKTVNQDDPSVYHLFYADEKGSPGADITFFEYPGASPGRAGAGMVHTVVWRIGSECGARVLGGATRGRRRRGSRDGEPPALRRSRGARPRARGRRTSDEPLLAIHPEIPPDAALQGFDAVRAFAGDPERAGRSSRALSASRLQETAAGRYEESTAAGTTPTIRRPASGAPPARALCTTSRGHRRWTTTRHGGNARSGRCPADPDHRPLLVPLDLLPRAERRPLRDRHARTRASRSTRIRSTSARR